MAGLQAGDSPMERFRKLAQKLVRVPKRELEEARAKKPKRAAPTPKSA